MYLRSYHLTCFFISIFLCHYAFSNAKIRYNLEDLKKLAKENNTVEFLDHYLDIEPTKRDESYQKMLIEVVINHGQKLIKNQGNPSESFNRYAKWLEHPSLKTNEFYRDNLTKLFIMHVDKCFKDAPYLTCEKEVKKYWPELKDHKLAIKLVKTITPYFDQEIEKHLLAHNGFKGDTEIINDLFFYAVKNPMAEFYCKDQSFYPLIKSLLIHKPTEAKSVHPDCFLSARQQIEKWFITGTLDEKKKLMKYVKNDLFQNYLSFRKILAPKTLNQQELNQAWNHFEKLKNKPSLRDQLISLVNQDDNLSLEYLTTVSNSKQKLITKHINLNFPEFYPYLKNQCSLEQRKAICSIIPK